MGGAFTAIAAEATGSFYNPAGIAVDASNLIQLSMSAYKIRVKKVLVADLCGTVLEDDRRAAFSFPASLGFVRIFRDGEIRHALGFGLTVPHADRSGQAVVERNAACGESSLDLGAASAVVDRALLGGATYAIRIKPWLQLGATAGISVRGSSSTLLVSVLERSPAASGDRPSVNFANLDVNLWSAYFQAGAIVEVSPGWRIGLSASTPYIRLQGRGALDVASASSVAGELEQTGILLLQDAEFHWKVPANVALGVAWMKPGFFTLAFDLRYHGGIDPYPLVTHPRLETIRVPMILREPVVNIAAGAEYWLSEKWIIRAGFFTNRSSFPTPSLEASDRDQVHLYGATAGVSFASDPTSLLSLAFQGQWGRGDVLTYRLTPDAQGKLFADPRLGDTEEALFLTTFGGSFDLH